MIPRPGAVMEAAPGRQHPAAPRPYLSRMAAPHPLSAPLTFAPRFRDYMWGGRRLAELGRDLPDGVVAESWEVSGHPDEPSIVDRGPLAGRDLPGLVADHGVQLVGTRGREAARRGVFPLLVKLLDASHALSVQVHPGDEHAAVLDPGESGKTEMWYILHADRGARVIHGLGSGVDRRALRRALAGGTVQECLNRVAVRPGDAVLVPAGTVHGILSGIVLVEIQQCSDTTYRIHDWDRLDPAGKRRKLHIDRALDVIDFSARGAVPTPARQVEHGGGVMREVLAECHAFVVERVSLEGGAVYESRLDGETCEIWGVLSGSATVEAGGGDGLGLEAVGFALMPATMGRLRLRAGDDVVALRARLP